MRKYTFGLSATSLLILTAFVTFFSSSNQALALSGSQFKPGNIINNSIFYRRSSMSSASIQKFLNSKVPSCDTNGSKMYNSTKTRAQYGKSKGNPAPYTCLKNKVLNRPAKSASEGLCSSISSKSNQTAAQIIYTISNACNVDSKVLLVMLQKEQSLITDDWPWSIQYRSAMGYGCPDTAACDSHYYGFFNQVYNAAKQLRRYSRDPADFNYRAGRTNYIQYNPNASCGGKNIYIDNSATAALYNYTPYVPNTAALNNLYGSGNSCSAYGNRNFWRMYNDWFGSTHSSYAAFITEQHIYTDPERLDEVGSVPKLRFGQSAYLTIKAKNTGSKTWSRSFTRIGTTSPNNRSSLFSDPSWISSGRPTQLVESSIAPGEIGTFKFVLTAPRVDGVYTEKFKILAEDRQWMSDSATFSIGITVSNPYNATINSINAYSDSSRTTPTNFRIKTGSTTYWRLSAKNIGANSWSQSTVKLGTANPRDRTSSLSNDSWLSGARVTRLSQSSVAKNASGTFDYIIEAPDTEQSLNEYYALLSEGNSWMPNSTFNVRLSFVDALDKLKRSKNLYLNEAITTLNNKKLTLQTDGNLVLRNSRGRAVWNSGTNGKGGSILTLQTDGNLVLRNSRGRAVWNSGTNGK